MNAWLGWVLVLAGGCVFAAGLVTENHWLIAAGLALLPVGVLLGLAR